MNPTIYKRNNRLGEPVLGPIPGKFILMVSQILFGGSVELTISKIQKQNLLVASAFGSYLVCFVSKLVMTISGLDVLLVYVGVISLVTSMAQTSSESAGREQKLVELLVSTNSWRNSKDHSSISHDTVKDNFQNKLLQKTSFWKILPQEFQKELMEKSHKNLEITSVETFEGNP